MGRMSEYMPATGGSFSKVPIIKYDGRAGRLFRVDRVQTANGWETVQVELTGFQALFDMENLEVGWTHFPVGGAPVMAMVKIGEPYPDKPTDKARQGFRLYLKLGKESGGDVREFAANASVTMKGIDALLDAYDEGVKANPGKLPLVKLSGTIPITTQGKGANGQPVSSTNYQPVFEIVRWLDRPSELQGDYRAKAEAQQPAQAQTHAGQPAQAQTHAGQPAQQQLATVDDDF